MVCANKIHFARNRAYEYQSVCSFRLEKLNVGIQTPSQSEYLAGYMFGWLKAVKNAAEGARTGTMAVDLWKQSFSEVVARDGAAQHDDFRFWFKIKDQFILKLKNHPALQTMRADVTYEERCVYYLVILQNEILRRTPKLFSPSELERIGEFIAFAVVRGPEEAIVVDPERASLIYDFLPRELVDGAGVPPDKFDALFYRTTGRHRMSRPA